jgi:metal-dependent amidase/aminoacylase/carboxypeptidase family protein
VKRATFTFKGRAAHAASAPHRGINALDAVRLTFNGVDMLRQHLRQDVRIHGIIPKGGTAANVVPDEAEAEFMVRALDTATMEDAYAKVVNCAKAGALATGATLEFTPPRAVVQAPIAVPELLTVVEDQMRAVGVQGEASQGGVASSDLGNVGHAYPTVNIRFQIAPRGVASHSDEFREVARTDEAWKATVQAGKVVALTAYELLTSPAKVKAIQAQFEELKAREGK